MTAEEIYKCHLKKNTPTYEKKLSAWSVSGLIAFTSDYGSIYLIHQNKPDLVFQVSLTTLEATNVNEIMQSEKYFELKDKVTAINADSIKPQLTLDQMKDLKSDFVTLLAWQRNGPADFLLVGTNLGNVYSLSPWNQNVCLWSLKYKNNFGSKILNGMFLEQKQEYSYEETPVSNANYNRNSNPLNTAYGIRQGFFVVTGDSKIFLVNYTNSELHWKQSVVSEASFDSKPSTIASIALNSHCQVVLVYGNKQGNGNLKCCNIQFSISKTTKKTKLIYRFFDFQIEINRMNDVPIPENSVTCMNFTGFFRPFHIVVYSNNKITSFLWQDSNWRYHTETSIMSNVTDIIRPTFNPKSENFDDYAARGLPFLCHFWVVRDNSFECLNSVTLEKINDHHFSEELESICVGPLAMSLFCLVVNNEDLQFRVISTMQYKNKIDDHFETHNVLSHKTSTRLLQYVKMPLTFAVHNNITVFEILTNFISKINIEDFIHNPFHMCK